MGKWQCHLYHQPPTLGLHDLSVCFIAVVNRGLSNERWICCRKGDPFQGPRVGFCLTLGNQLSKETHVLTKQETLLGTGARVESRRVWNPGGLLCHVAHNLGSFGDGISFRLVSGQSF